MAHTHSAFKIKYLLPVLALILSAALCVGGALAWLAENRDLDTSGMKMQATATANLVISAESGNTNGGIMDPAILDNAQTPFSVSFASVAADSVQPCTHVLNAGSYNLKYCKTPEGIQYDTGLPISGTVDALLDNVPQAQGYFHDYTVYIASAGAALTNVALKAAVTVTDVATLTDTHKALSVDIYLDGTSASNYKATLHAADGAAQQLCTIDIPANASSYLTVIMRVYFDGALTDATTGNAYITSQNISVADLGITVLFSAEAS